MLWRFTALLASLRTLNRFPCMLSAGHREESDGHESLLTGEVNRLKGNAKRKRTKATGSFGVCRRPSSTLI
jgi:hypothetical protein